MKILNLNLFIIIYYYLAKDLHHAVHALTFQTFHSTFKSYEIGLLKTLAKLTGLELPKNQFN